MLAASLDSPTSICTPRARASVQLAKTDVLDSAIVSRLRHEVTQSVARRGSRETLLAAVLQHLAHASSTVRRLIADAGLDLMKRSAFDRPLLAAALYSYDGLGGAGEAIAIAAIAADNAPWGAFVAATTSSSSALHDALLRLSMRGQGHARFGAELVRSLRGESVGGRAAELAVMLKEAHRVKWVEEFVLPVLARDVALAAPAVRTLEALRGVERHMGRWLRIGELEVECGGGRAAADCRREHGLATESARNVWAWMEWLLASRVKGRTTASMQATAPARLTREVVNKLSDRASTQRDLSFLHRLASRGVAPEESLVATARARTTTDAVRAMIALVTHYGRTEWIERIRAVAQRGAESVRGLSVAALWDIGDRDAALEAVDELVVSKSITNLGWGAMVRVAHLTGDGEPIVSESAVRRLCEGHVY